VRKSALVVVALQMLVLEPEQAAQESAQGLPVPVPPASPPKEMLAPALMGEPAAGRARVGLKQWQLPAQAPPSPVP
jgi:hypothetical protein